jgi:hypothetical protein
MLIKEWNFTDEIVRNIEEDVFYCDKLNRMVDLGWDEYVSIVHDWIRVLNIVNGELHKNGITTEIIEMNDKTFELIRLEHNEYYKNDRLGSYLISINEDVKNKTIQLTSNNNVVSKILIKTKQK